MNPAKQKKYYELLDERIKLRIRLNKKTAPSEFEKIHKQYMETIAEIQKLLIPGNAAKRIKPRAA